jgi:hypothetical protein
MVVVECDATPDPVMITMMIMVSGGENNTWRTPNWRPLNNIRAIREEVLQKFHFVS